MILKYSWSFVFEAWTYRVFSTIRSKPNQAKPNKKGLKTLTKRSWDVHENSHPNGQERWTIRNKGDRKRPCYTWSTVQNHVHVHASKTKDQLYLLFIILSPSRLLFKLYQKGRKEIEDCVLVTEAVLDNERRIQSLFLKF